MLPKNLEDFIPEPLLENIDDSGRALINFFEEFINNFFEDILNIWYFTIPERMDVRILEFWNSYLNADFFDNDTEIEKRQKISTAILRNRLKSTFLYDVKLKIDFIAGGDSTIFTSFESADWIRGGDGKTIPSISYWATRGGDGVDDKLGIDRIGIGNEIEIPGNIYINVDNDSLTGDDIARIVANITSSLPVYMRIFLGYINISGQFITYTIIG